MNHWYHPDKFFLKSLLMPLSFLFRFIVCIRKNLYRGGVFNVKRFPVPIIVVGNLTVGGTGKTPLLIELARHFTALNYRVGIVSRGYGGRQVSPYLVQSGDDPSRVGDEAVLLARRAHCPVVVARDRAMGVEYLLGTLSRHCVPPFPASGRGAGGGGSFVVLSDDGLQHYGLHRDIEIVVIDGERRFGNNACLPAGPLREPLSRLKTVDFKIVNGKSDNNDEYSFQIKPEMLRRVIDDAPVEISACQGKTLHALAGIGHPQRFFNTLRQLGLTFTAHVFPDHYAFTAKDIAFTEAERVVMTEKDAVKCRQFADNRHLYLPIILECEPRFLTDLTRRLP